MRRWSSAAALGALAPAVAAAYSPVTDERLKNPEPENWLMFRGNYQGWMYSPLNQINTNNVKHLSPVWSYSTGVDSGHQAPPIVNDGVMFVATPYDKSSRSTPRPATCSGSYQRELPEASAQLHNTKRGVGAVRRQGVRGRAGRLPGRTRRQDRRGRMGDRPVDDWQQGYYMTMAPLIAKGKVMVGVVRRRVRHSRLRRGATTPRPASRYGGPTPSRALGEPGHDTWQGDTWQKGGASVWMTGHLRSREQRSPIGAPATARPGSAISGPGDNLYTTSTVAIDADTGQIKGHLQYHWNDSWDWDEI